MSLAFRVRDWLHPPVKILHEAGVRAGMTVLDFGCGPGSFSLAAAALVGAEGRVYALDVSPLAIRSVRRSAARRGLNNIRAISGGELAGIAAGSVDVVLLYDVLHLLPEPASTLADVHRVLKPEGALSVSDHHWPDKRLVAAITAAGGFQLAGRGAHAHQFRTIMTGNAVP
ncbi:MAG: class I SAM-dependent methyltransferase [Pirellulales bacterium]|nr:class I SAM-dependent methyltransferase [Pirellulales bacterium]